MVFKVKNLKVDYFQCKFYYYGLKKAEKLILEILQKEINNF